MNIRLTVLKKYLTTEKKYIFSLFLYFLVIDSNKEVCLPFHQHDVLKMKMFSGFSLGGEEQ